MDCVMSRMSTVGLAQDAGAPATMPGRFLPRTVMTIREDEISAWETLSRDCGARGALRYGTVFIIVPVWRKKARSLRRYMPAT